ncbi:VOC family protein [Hirschia litorea]|uniref:VOC family protein n=1 Tax=Hirschia litorea TaxID=1199156 RepID=A0ABW2IPH0_9PROT
MSSKPEIRGLYESCIGVPNLIDAIRFWGQFGYKIVGRGELSQEKAASLYNVDSNLQSVRLRHQNADHSFIRLMQWDTPKNYGIGPTSTFRQDGGRWGVFLTQSILNILNHVEDAIAQGEPWNTIFPHWLQVYAMDKGEPFFDPPLGVREGIACHPFWRLAIFERYNYEKKTYGNIDETSFMKASQFTHHGILVRADSADALKFYDQTLGLMRQKEQTLGGKPTCSSGNKETFALSDDEIYHIHDFDDPRSSLEISGHLSGRLKIVRMETTSDMPDVYEKSSPGALGMSLYTYQVRDIEEYRKRVIDGGATKVSNIQDNEFGTPSITFTAPDGNIWNLVGDL